MDERGMIKIGEAVLYHGDCLDIIPTLGPVSHVICDPPFEDHMHVAKSGARGLRKDGYASPKPVDFESISEIRDVLAWECIKKCDGWMLFFCTPEGVAPWRDALEGVGAKYKRALFWLKPDSAPQFNGQGPAMAVECIVSSWVGEGYSKWNGGGSRNYFIHATNNGERTGLHPTEKPLALMRELISLFTNPGDVILDPMMGVGTTGVAAIELGRRFIGIEKNEKYFDVACKRLEQVGASPKLFIEGEIVPSAKQLEMF